MRKNNTFYIMVALLLAWFLIAGCTSKPPTVKTIPTDTSSQLVEGTVISSGSDTNESGATASTATVADSGEEAPPESSLKQEETPADILEDALEAYKDAQAAWDKADVDTALAALDEAYGLILRLVLPAESTLTQEKNDLRLLIAQRIQEIYASHLLATGDNRRTIPLAENQYVLAEIKRFQIKERKYFMDAYRRSGRYRKMILDKIKEAGLPEELSWIPVIESGFKVRAYSRARALGLWQFISSTGYRYGLKRTRWIDERMDPEKATDAALKYLKELHAIFGDWTTALASYNCGEFRVQRLIRAQRINYLDNFWDLFTMLPRETARFVPRFIATLLIVTNPDKYGFSLPEPDPPLTFEEVIVKRPVRLSSLSKALRLENETLAALNPELRHQSTPEGEYELKVPAAYKEKTETAIRNMNKWIPPEATYVIHRVRSGETVSGIARRYRTSVRSIARSNGLRRNYLIRPGQRLKIPVRGSRSTPSATERKLIREKTQLIYVVQHGDSLNLIARHFNTSVDKIKQLNKLTDNKLRVGQRLIIVSGNMEGAIRYTVRSGDTPYSIARAYGMDLHSLLSLNGLRSRSRIYPGQQLWVIPANKRR